MKNSRQIILVIFICLFSISTVISQTVLKHQNPNENLKNRWDWAFDQAKKQNFNNGFWVAYSIKRLMGENSFTGTFYDPPRDDLKTLRELLGMEPEKNRFDNVSDVEVIKKEAEKALKRIKDKDKPERKVWKEVAFLFRYTSTKKDFSAIEKMKFSNLSLVVELDDLPLIWLGKANDEQSISLLTELYPETAKEKNKERLIAAVSFHQNSKLVIPFLKSKLQGNESVNIRKKAAFWLGQRDEKAALDILAWAVENDPSVKVREQVVFAISQMELEAATDKLIDLAQNSTVQAVQEKAVFWLGQKASQKAAQALEDVVQNDADTKIQEKAVFAISQLPAEKSVPKLIEIAKNHPNAKVRKKAIFWLGQSDDQRAVDAIVSIVRGK